MRLLRHDRRSGSIAPVIAISLVALCGAVALAIDVGRVAVAKLQCQSAVDVAAMAGARTLNGIMPQDLATATTNAQNAAMTYQIMGQHIVTGDLTVTHGTYHYDTTAQQFVPSFTLLTGDNYNLTKVSITKSCPTTFANVFGFSAFNVNASATAAHRPRDVAIVLDYSGSMNNESDLWNNESYLDNGQSAPNNPNNTSNNQESVYPKFGHYSKGNNYSDYTNFPNLLCPVADGSNPLTGNSVIGKCNATISALGVAPLVNDFWSNSRGSSASSAFPSVSDSSLDSYNRAGGDTYLFKQGSPTVFASTLTAALGSSPKNSAWEVSGYKSHRDGDGHGVSRLHSRSALLGQDASSSGPPTRTMTGGRLISAPRITPKLWNGSGNWNDPSGNYTINYKAILTWIKSLSERVPVAVEIWQYPLLRLDPQ